MCLNLGLVSPPTPLRSISEQLQIIEILSSTRAYWDYDNMRENILTDVASNPDQTEFCKSVLLCNRKLKFEAMTLCPVSLALALIIVLQ